MLKIKNDIPLEELEKYGFKEEIGWCIKNWYIKNVYIDGVIIYNYTVAPDRELFIDTNNGFTYLDNTLYDMIQDGIVEKVE